MLRNLPFILAFAALSLFTACSGSGGSKFRLVQAISDIPSQQAVDVYIDTKKVGTVSLGGATPASGYLSVSSGARHLQLYLSGQVTGPYFDGNVTVGSGGNTVVATGNVNGNTIVAPLFTDNATASTTANNAQLRIIQASPEGLGGTQAVDIYIVGAGGNLPGTTPDIAGVAYPAASAYKSFPAGTYDLLLTPAGIASLNITIAGATFAAGKNYTYVLVDAQNGGSMSGTPVVLNDN